MRWFAPVTAVVVSIGLSVPATAQSVVDVLPATDGAWGLDYHDGALWQGDDFTGLIYKLSPIDGAVLDSLPSPYDQTRVVEGSNHGVAWDDSTLWVAGDYGKGWIFRLDATGATLDSIPAPSDAIGDLAWSPADSLLLATTYFSNQEAGVLRIDPADGSQIGSTITVSGEQPYGVTFNPADSTVWNAMNDFDGDAETVDQFSYPGGAQLTQFLSPADGPRGAAVGEGYLWLVADNNAGPGRRIYKIDVGTGPTPDLAVAPTFYDFGVMAVGDTLRYEQLVLNEGGADLTVTNIAVLPPMYASSDTLPQIVAPGDTLRVDMMFTTGSFGFVSRTMTIASDAPEPTVDIVLSGTAVPMAPTAIVAPASVPFPDTAVGLVRDETVTIENVGFEDLILNEITIDDPHFTLVIDAVFPDTLSTFETLDIQIIFAPTDVTPVGATLSIDSNDSQTPMSTRDVTGMGIEKAFAGGDIIWQAPGLENVVNTIAIPDVNGDSIADAVMETYDAGADPGAPHRAYYGNSDELGVELWQAGTDGGGGYGEQALALLEDIDADTWPEIVRGVSWEGRRVELRESESGDLLWEFDTTPFDGGGWIYSVAVLPDVTGDDVDDVVAAIGTDSGVGTGARRVVCLSGADGAERWAFTGADAFLSVAAGDDVNGDLVPDVVAGAGGNGADTFVRCIDGASVGAASELWSFDTGGSVWSVAFISDVTGDGINDVVAGSWSQNVYCLDGVTGDLEWTAPIGGGVVRVEVVDDVNGDLIPDIAVANLSTSFRMLSGVDGLPLWVLPVGDSTWSTAAIADVTDDGVIDILIGSESDATICADGATGDVAWQVDLGSLVHVVRPISDVNGNGYDDVLAGTQRLGEVGGDLVCIEGGTAVVGIEDTPPVATGVRFQGLSANPMPGRGAFIFDVRDAAGAKVEVSIFDAGGRHVRSLIHRVNPGTSQLAWDGLDASGRRVQSGAYFFRIRGLKGEGRARESVTGKLTIIQ